MRESKAQATWVASPRASRAWRLRSRPRTAPTSLPSAFRWGGAPKWARKSSQVPSSRWMRIPQKNPFRTGLQAKVLGSPTRGGPPRGPGDVRRTGMGRLLGNVRRSGWEASGKWPPERMGRPPENVRRGGWEASGKWPPQRTGGLREMSAAVDGRPPRDVRRTGPEGLLGEERAREGRGESDGQGGPEADEEGSGPEAL